MVTLAIRAFATLLILLLPGKPVHSSPEPQSVQDRPVLLDTERQEIERRQREESFRRNLENWDRRVRDMKRGAPPPGAQTVDVEELRVPKKARDERNRAWRELQKNKLDSAEKRATRAIAFYPDYVGAYVLRGEIRLRTGRIEAAEADFEKAAALRPDEALVPTWIAVIFLRGERPDLALGRINSVIGRFGENAWNVLVKGQAEFNLQRFDQAELSFRRGLALKKTGDHLSFFYLARICCADGRHDEAIALLRPLLDESHLKVDRLQVIALIEHAEHLKSLQTQAPSP
jgi:tetratricopeptide (TPR) repeat protein